MGAFGTLVRNKPHLSANYFGDLIKKETGKSAQERSNVVLECHRTYGRKLNHRTTN